MAPGQDLSVGGSCGEGRGDSLVEKVCSEMANH